MAESKRIRRAIVRWTVRLLIVVVVLIGLQVSVLAFPQMLLPHATRSGTVVIYTRTPVTEDIERLAARVDHRLHGCEFYDSTRTDRVFLFENQDLYKFYVRLSLLPNVPQGFGLSIFGNSYVDVNRNRSLGDWTGGVPKYSIYDGNLSHLIAHEIAHHYVTDRIGRSRWKSLPHWKREGLPEYIANIGPVEEDGASLESRIAILRDDTQWWAAGRADGREGWDRIHYRAGLLIEYLIREEGYTIDEIVSDTTDRNEIENRMYAWAESQAARL